MNQKHPQLSLSLAQQRTGVIGGPGDAIEKVPDQDRHPKLITNQFAALVGKPGPMV